MPKTVICERCSDIIENNVDLATTLSFRGILAYHMDCYAETQKGWNPAGSVINSSETILVIVVFALLCSILFVVYHEMWLFLVLALILPTVRFLSWWAYERRLR